MSDEIQVCVYCGAAAATVHYDGLLLCADCAPVRCERCDSFDDVEDVTIVEIGGEPDERIHREVPLCRKCRERLFDAD